MKRELLNISYKLGMYIFVFVVIILFLIHLFMVVLLDSFYRFSKVQDIDSIANNISYGIDDDNLQRLVSDIALQDFVSIWVVDESGDLIASAGNRATEDMYLSHEYAYFYDKALDSDNGIYFEHHTESEYDSEVSYTDDSAVRTRFYTPQRIEYAKLVAQADNNIHMVLISSIISPLNATVDTIMYQLFCIMFIIIIIAFLMSYMLSKKIAKPLMATQENAKKLASRDYTNISLESGGYLEVCQLNQVIYDAAKQLHVVDELQKELLANVSHDLRTPLTLISGYAEVMRDIPGENNAENAQLIIDESQHLTNLVNNILDLSKLRSGVGKIEAEKFNLSVLAQEIISKLNILNASIKKQISFRYDGDTFVFADKVKISQVIQNLVSNAFLHSKTDAQINVTVSCVDNKVRFEVVDFGVGIPPQKLPLIWDRYYSSGRSDVMPSGEGLGLAIVKAILDLHNANYGAQSEVNTRTVFWFELDVTT